MANDNGKYSLPRIVFSHKSLLHRLQISFLEIEVCSSNYLSTLVSGHPIDNLWRVGSEESAVVSVQRFAVFAREDPDVGESTVADVLQVFFETSERR